VIREVNPTRVISIGFAGALDGSLRVGDVIELQIVHFLLKVSFVAVLAGDRGEIDFKRIARFDQPVLAKRNQDHRRDQRMKIRRPALEERVVGHARGDDRHRSHRR